MFRIGGKKAYSFTDKVHSKNGIISTVLGAAGLLLIIFSIAKSVSAKGHAQMTMGFLGMIALIFFIVGLVFGISGYFEEDTFVLFKNTGTIGNGAMLAICIAFIVVGLL